MTLIDHLKGMIKEVHGMEPNYSECEDNEQRYAHPSWAMNPENSEFNDRNERPTSTPIDSKPDSTPPCQTPRECQTRSTATLKKPSMKQHTQQIFATTSQCAQRFTQQISATTEPDLLQFGSENDDETWLTEFIGSRTTGPYEAAAQAYIDAWGIFWHKQDTSHQNLKTQTSRPSSASNHSADCHDHFRCAVFNYWPWM